MYRIVKNRTYSVTRRTVVSVLRIVIHYFSGYTRFIQVVNCVTIAQNVNLLLRNLVIVDMYVLHLDMFAKRNSVG